jgi:hypothetical protein
VGHGIVRSHCFKVSIERCRDTFFCARCPGTHHLLYLLGIANREKPVAAVSLADLSRYVLCDTGHVSQHMRDAVLGAVTALAQREKRQGWKNLFEEEIKPIRPFGYPVEYWMPWDLVKVARPHNQ